MQLAMSVVLRARLSEIMKEGGVTQQEWATRSGVPRNNINQLLRGGKADCNTATLDRLAESLGYELVIQKRKQAA